MNKKAQISLGDAPSVVMIVGLVFLILATLAFIGSEYGDAMSADMTTSVSNETLISVTETGEYVANYTLCNFETFAVTQAVNATDGIVIPTANYTYTQAGLVKYTGPAGTFNNTNWKVTYTAKYTGAACSVTNDLQTEIENNTSIAGIVLTISLIGIVLSVLVGVFVLARNRGM